MTIDYGLSKMNIKGLKIDSNDIGNGRNTVVKVYAKVLCADVEYKTLSIKYHTTAREMIQMLLNKFRMKHTDPNLFYLTMEVWIRNTGIPIRSVVMLDDKACLAQIQASYPHQESKFSLVMKRGGLVKVYDGCLMPTSRYKSLLISDHTTVEELIQLLLHCYDSDEKPAKFALYEVGLQRQSERKLNRDEFPLQLQNEWPTQDIYHFELRRNNDEPSRSTLENGIQKDYHLSCCKRFSQPLRPFPISRPVASRMSFQNFYCSLSFGGGLIS